MSSDRVSDARSSRRSRSPDQQRRAERTQPKPSTKISADDDDEDDAYVTRALEALHTVHTERTMDDRKESEDDTRHDRKEVEWKDRSAWRDEHKRQHRHREPVRRHSSEKTSRSSRRQPTFPFSDSSSSLSDLLTASTSSASTTSSTSSPHSTHRASASATSTSLDRAYTARFAHLSSALLALLSSLPHDPSLPALLRSPLTAAYLSDRLRELLVGAMADEREAAVRRAWEGVAAEEGRRRRAERVVEEAMRERAEEKARWEEEKATLHRQLQQCEQSLRAERRSNEQWETQRQLLERHIKQEQQQREEAETDCQKLEVAIQQLQQKYKQQQQSYTQLQQTAEQTSTQLTQLQEAHTTLANHNTQLNSQLAAAQSSHTSKLKQLTVELSARKLSLQQQQSASATREAQLVAAVGEWKERSEGAAGKVRVMEGEREEAVRRERAEAAAREKEKAAVEAEVGRLKAALQEQKERMDERIVRMKELTIREWKDREAELLSAIQEEHGKAEELLGWVNHSSDQMAAMKQRLLDEREQKARADSEWQTERQRWEQSTRQREEQLKAAEQAIAAQQQQILAQSQQLAADIDKHHSQLNEANERANKAHQQMAELQSSLQTKDVQIAQQKQETKDLLAHARLELTAREKQTAKLESRMHQLQPQLLHTARRLTLLTSALPPLLAAVRQLQRQQTALNTGWRAEWQAVIGAGWEGAEGGGGAVEGVDEGGEGGAGAGGRGGRGVSTQRHTAAQLAVVHLRRATTAATPAPLRHLLCRLLQLSTRAALAAGISRHSVARRSRGATARRQST